MEVSEKILQLLNRWGVPLVVVIIVVAVYLVYNSYLNTQLTKLQIAQLQKELAT